MQDVYARLYRCVNRDALYTAIEADDSRELSRWLDYGFDVNRSAEGRATPLQFSLISQKPACTLVLLQHKADVNAWYKRAPVEKTIQPHINGDDRSNVRLLAIFGADLDGVNFNNKRDLKKIFDEAREQYKKIKNFEAIIDDKNTTLTDKHQAYLGISKVWESLRDAEKAQSKNQSKYIAFYEEQVARYYVQAHQSNFQSVSVQTMNSKQQDSGLRHRTISETKPLLRT